MAASIDGGFTKPWRSFFNRTAVWLGLSLAFAILYRLPPLHEAFSAAYMVQDDARQHVFWMQRFTDPTLFPNDFIADYFQSVAPWGYTKLYQFGVALGFDVWTFNKVLPILIAGVATLFAFGTVLQIIPVPWAAFMGATFLNQTFPLRDDVVSATPAAFFHPFFLAFIYFTLRCSWLPGALSIILMGLFYPQGVLIMGGTLLLMAIGLIRFKGHRLYWRGTSKEVWLLGSGLLASFLVLLPYALQDSAYGPVLTLDQARNMFALSPQGWSKFFDDDPLDFWLFGKRTGLFPFEWSTLDLKVQPQIWLTVALPFLALLPGRSPLTKTVAPRLWLLLQVAAASVICYALAHLLLFELHLPNRYTEHSFRALVAIGAGVGAALIGERFRSLRPSPTGKKILWALVGTWAIAPLAVGLIVDESRGNYLQGQQSDLYTFLQAQPKTTVVASLDEEINQIPSFAQRSIFVGGEGFTLPYHLGYYTEVKQRSVDLIEAQYTTEKAVLEEFLDDNAIDLWMMSNVMFTPQWINSSHWLLQYSQDTRMPLIMLESGQPSILQQTINQCQQQNFGNLIVVKTDCLKTKLKSFEE